MRILDYPELNLDENSILNYVIPVDGYDGTKKMRVKDMINYLSSISPQSNIYSLLDQSDIPVYFRKKIYRGKKLGAAVSDETWASIEDGSFNDLFIGDYWEIRKSSGGYFRYVICDMDYWLGSGDTPCTKHHLVIAADIPSFRTGKMNLTNSTNGGYIGSYIRKSTLSEDALIPTMIKDAFGDSHILRHREVLTNGVLGDYPSSFAYVDSTIEIPSETMVFGTRMFSSNGTLYTQLGSWDIVKNVTIDTNQLSIMQFSIDAITQTKGSYNPSFWLRDVASSTSYSCVTKQFSAFAEPANNTNGILPIFGIVG